MEAIKANLIFEILGRPQEHVKESLTTLVIKMGSEKGVTIINKTLHEPILAKDSKDLFTAFAEIEIEFESMENLFAITFSYLPSNIEIFSPENLTISNNQLNELNNVLIQRIHSYDAVTKRALMEQKIAVEKLKEVAPEAFEKLVKAATAAQQKEESKSGK